MPPTKPPYGPAFWSEAVRLTREPGNTIKGVARDLGVSYEGCVARSTRLRSIPAWPRG
jgi:hypothetical protein